MGTHLNLRDVLSQCVGLMNSGQSGTANDHIQGPWIVICYTEGVHMWVCLRVLTLTQDNLGFWSACTVQHSSPGVLLSLCLHSCNAVLARHAFGFMSTPVCAVACQHQWTAMQDDQCRVIC